MRFLAGFGLIISLTWITSFLTPWWWAGVCFAAIVGFSLQLKDWQSFLCGFLSLGSLWLLLLYLKNSSNEGMLLAKMKSILGISMESNFTFILLVAILAGLLAGLAMLSGKLFRDLVTGTVTEAKNKRPRRRKRRR